MLSSTELKRLLDAKKYEDFKGMVDSFYAQKSAAADVESSRKLVNLIAYRVSTEKNCPLEVLQMLANVFQRALDLFICAKPNPDVLVKIMDSCYHVVKRISETKTEADFLLEFMKKLTQFSHKFKTHLSSSSYHIGIVVIVLTSASRTPKNVVSLCKTAFHYYQAASNGQDMFKAVKDVSSILLKADKSCNAHVIEFVKEDVLEHVEGIPKVPMLLFCQDHPDFEREFCQISQEIHDIIVNNLNEDSKRKLLGPHIDRFLYCTSKKCQALELEDPKTAEKLIDLAKSLSTLMSGVKTTPSLFSIIQIKYNICYKSHNYSKALECSELLAEHASHDKEFETAAKLFVNAKRKLLSDDSLRTKNLPKPAQKFEMIQYRPYSEFLKNREALAENMLSEAESNQGKVRAYIELMWVCHSARSEESLQHGLSYIDKSKKMALSIAEVDIKAPLFFWCSMLKLAFLRHELKKIDAFGNANSKDDEDNSDEMTSNRYCQILSLDSDSTIIDDLAKSHELACQSSSEEMAQMRAIIEEYFDIMGKDLSKSPSEDQIKLLIDGCWDLLRTGHFDHLNKNLDTLSKSAEACAETYEAKILKAEINLLKGHLAMNGFHQGSEGPLDLGWFAVRACASTLAHFDKHPPSDLSRILIWIRTVSIATKSTNFILDVAFRIGLGREMKLFAKQCIDVALELSLVEHLCHQILNSVEADLYCDNGKQAQIKLREVENLLKGKLRSEKPDKLLKTSISKTGTKRKVLPNLDDDEMCSSPALTKAFYGLPQKPEEAIEVIVKYFTFQGVVWHLEQDNEAMVVYFDLVLGLAKKMRNTNKHVKAIFPALKWMFESYAHLDQFDQCKLILEETKLWLLIDPDPFWTTAFKASCVALHLAVSNSSPDEIEPSPIKPGMELFDQAERSKTPDVTKQKVAMKTQQKRPKKAAYPTGADLDLSKLAALSLDDAEDIPELEVKISARKTTKMATLAHDNDIPDIRVDAETPMKSQRSSSKAKNSAFKTPRGKVTSAKESEDMTMEEFKTPISKTATKRTTRSSAKTLSSKKTPMRF